ncbi:MAG: molybdopterin molybdotransferase MoeA [Solirubrobacterales bacterium]|nr:molybdopterin molybdotransferase MoeA [Solirubrobacterales bacterium]
MAETLITINEARARVLRATRTLPPETVAVEDAADRVLAHDLRAVGNVPAFPCSAMDGYAIKAGPAGRTLTVIGESRAGTPAQREVHEGEAIRISTGGAIPVGAEAVIPQENVDQRDGTVTTGVPTAAGVNLRHAGEDMRSGTLVLEAGTVLRAAELGATVAAGAGNVVVRRRPVVAVLCTGDELRPPGEPLGPGQIHNSNAPMLVALARHGGAVVKPAQRIADDRAATETTLAHALQGTDVVIISGGVSVGPHDHVKPALAALGVEERFWGVALQPGKPTWFGERGRQLVFGLPGNPVSAAVTFSLFARPAIAALQGADSGSQLDREAVLGHAVARNPNREQALRVRLERRDGATIAIANGPQGSHILSSLLGADALALIPPGPGEVQAGTAIALEPLAR